MLQPQARKPVRDPETSIGEFASHGPELQPECVTPQEFREALSRAVTPVTVIATSGPSGKAGVTCSAVCSVSDTPPTVLVCVNRKSFANGIIKANGVLTVNWLSAAQSSVSQLFAGVGAVPMEERFAPGQWAALATGAPSCKDALVSLDCQVVSAMEVGTHSIFLARVVATVQAEDGYPLVYCQRMYATTQPTES